MRERFFQNSGPLPLFYIAEQIQADLDSKADGSRMIEGVRTLGSASSTDLTFFDNRRYVNQLAKTTAGACVLAAKDAEHAPQAVTVLRSDAPYQAFASAVQLFYADTMRSKAAMFNQPMTQSLVHPSAQIAEGAAIEAGAIIGREAQIGKGTVVSAGAVIGYRSVLGDDCYVGPGASVVHAVLGNGVIIHSGVRIGQDGFGFAMGKSGHVKVPQIGCVIIADNVEIGANSTIDRGTLDDTRIGEGTKIDNLVQIGHNVVIGRHCVIVAQSGIAGSAELGDFVVMGAQSGVLGHVKIGSGAQIAGMAHVKNDVLPGSRMGGTPAKPFNEWARELAAMRALGKRRRCEI
ncbi:MAG: UDP-3-O-(3-hydroxymyristoyl)glucosamine N-acyltransferase [Hyphomicrobiaceae bacterium]